MSRQNLIIASLMMSYQVGIRQHAFDLEDKLRVNAKEFTDAMAPYIQHGIDFIEEATGMTMVTPEDGVYKVFMSFGIWFGNECKASKKLPTPENAYAALRQYVVGQFDDAGAGQDVLERLNSHLSDIIKGYLDE